MSENGQALFDLARTLGVLAGLILLLVALVQRLIAGVRYDCAAKAATAAWFVPGKPEDLQAEMRRLRRGDPKPEPVVPDRSKLDELLELVRLRREGLRV